MHLLWRELSERFGQSFSEDVLVRYRFVVPIVLGLQYLRQSCLRAMKWAGVSSSVGVYEI